MEWLPGAWGHLCRLRFLDGCHNQQIKARLGWGLGFGLGLGLGFTLTSTSGAPEVAAASDVDDGQMTEMQQGCRERGSINVQG